MACSKQLLVTFRCTNHGLLGHLLRDFGRPLRLLLPLGQPRNQLAFVAEGVTLVPQPAA